MFDDHEEKIVQLARSGVCGCAFQCTAIHDGLFVDKIMKKVRGRYV